MTLAFLMAVCSFTPFIYSFNIMFFCNLTNCGFVNVIRTQRNATTFTTSSPTEKFILCFRERILNFMTSLDEMIGLPADLQFKLLSNRLPEAVVMAKVIWINMLNMHKQRPEYPFIKGMTAG